MATTETVNPAAVAAGFLTDDNYRRIVRSSREFISKPDYTRLLDIFAGFGAAGGAERKSLIAEAYSITGELDDNGKPCVAGGLTHSYMWDSRHLITDAEEAVSFVLERLRLDVR